MGRDFYPVVVLNEKGRQLSLGQILSVTFIQEQYVLQIIH